MGEFERIIWIVLDSVGIGELPDAADYGDAGRSTLGHIAESRPLDIPNLVRLGLANIATLRYVPSASSPLGAYGKGATRSPGKDTTTGHWEMAGRAASRRESDRAAVHGNARQLCAHFAPARLCGGPAETNAHGCPGGTQSASVWNRQDS